MGTIYIEKLRMTQTTAVWGLSYTKFNDCTEKAPYEPVIVVPIYYQYQEEGKLEIAKAYASILSDKEPVVVLDRTFDWKRHMRGY